MTHPMLEKVARGIAQLQWADPDALASKCYGKQITIPDAPIWKSYVREARAAIEAIREPTSEMLSAPFEFHPIPQPWDLVANKIIYWQAMIDHILKGEG